MIFMGELLRSNWLIMVYNFQVYCENGDSSCKLPGRIFKQMMKLDNWAQTTMYPFLAVSVFRFGYEH